MSLHGIIFDIDGSLAGACGGWRDTGHLYADVDHALEIASLAGTASH